MAVPANQPISTLECRLLLGLVGLSCVLLALGAMLPLLTVERMWVFENSFSLIGGLWQMAQQGRWLLALLLAGFSLLLPLLKMGLLAHVLLLVHKGKSADSVHVQSGLQWVYRYGKWSMLDVFVVAVLVASVKLGALAQVVLHSGLYAFAASVLLTMLITARIVARIHPNPTAK